MNVAATDAGESGPGFGSVRGTLVVSGHESFACRYGWLPKFYEAVRADPMLFDTPEKAILRLGIGNNMVKSIRFWAEAFALARSERGRTRLTDLAVRLLDKAVGLDPYLESQDALWRLHWMLTVHGRLAAWAVAFLETHDREMSRERLIASVASRAAVARGGRVTDRTVTNHVDILMRTYAATRNTEQASADVTVSPFQELNLLRTGTRAGKPTVTFPRDAKRTLTTGAFAFAVRDFWHHAFGTATSISLRSLVLAHCAPASVFLLDETDLYDKTERLCSASRHLALRPDGGGGFTLTSDSDPLAELDRLAWPT